MPMTNGFRIIPFDLRALATAQGSSSQASIPSVIKTITFLQFEHSGKSFAAYSRLRAIGVVPWGVRLLNRVLILSILSSPGAKGTSSLVSSQFCCPGYILY